MTSRERRLLRRSAWIVGSVVVGAALLVAALCVTVIAVFFVGPFALLIPLGVLWWAASAVSRRRRPEGCPVCGGPLLPAVVESDGVDARRRLALRAVYTCRDHAHRSWRRADEGGPLTMKE